MSFRIGMAGLGRMGRQHLECYMKMNGVRVSVADPFAEEREALAMGASSFYRDMDDMLENEALDGMDICLPSFLHRAYTVKALEAGLDVLVEKPLALDASDMELMLEAEAKSKRRIMAGHVCRFMGQYLKAKALIEGEVLGKPLFFTAWRLSPTPSGKRHDWMNDKNLTGGTVMDLQVHDIDIANWFFGEPADFCMVEQENPKQKGMDFCHVVSRISYTNGVVAVLEAGHLMPGSYAFTSGYRLIFEDGALEFYKTEGGGYRMNLYEKSGSRDMEDWYRRECSMADPYFEELEHFINCVRTGLPFRINAREAKKAVETALKLKGASRFPHRIF